MVKISLYINNFLSIWVFRRQTQILIDLLFANVASFWFAKKTKKLVYRQLQDSNLRGQSPKDF